MKCLTKLKIKYLLIITCLLIILGIIFPTFMRYYVSVTANIVGYAKETRTSTYKIKFHSNGGIGQMEDMTMNYNVSYNLIKNTFTLENYNFGGWNTEIDGSGTHYTDEQEIINTTFVTGNEINLYAQWTQNPIYTVEYNSNGGTGNMQAQSFEYGVSQRLKQNTFTKEGYVFLHWNTKSDGTGTTYEEEEEVNNLTDIGGATVTLYAIYVREKYINNNDIVFDGTNYIDTGIHLFSEKNIYKNFEISFEIKERGSNASFATMMSAMDETRSPWPGIVYRVSNATTDQLAANATSTKKIDNKYRVSNIQKITLKRISGILYLSFNDESDTQMLDLSLITTPFEVPVTFGAGLKADKTPFRYFTGTLSNLKVIITDSETGLINFNKNGGEGTDFFQFAAPNTTITLIKNTYTRSGYEFDGWNTKADGTGTSYADQEAVTNIVDIGKTITLYAKWRKYVYTVQFDANGGTGSMEAQEFESTVAQQLNTSTFTKEGYSFAFWNTSVDGSGKSYENEEEVINLATSNGAIVKLYAIYENYSYEYEGDIVFDGTNFINTNIYLFSKKNVNKDFEISCEIKERLSTEKLATIISAIDESGSPYPGYVFRLDNDGKQLQLEANSSKTTEKNIRFSLDSVIKIDLKRVSGILYLKVNDGEYQQVIDYSTLKRFFYSPLSFGASLDGKLKPRRYFTGTLSNIRVTLFE